MRAGTTYLRTHLTLNLAPDLRVELRRSPLISAELAHQLRRALHPLCTLHPPQAGRALHPLCTLHPDEAGQPERAEALVSWLGLGLGLRLGLGLGLGLRGWNWGEGEG